MSKYLIVNFADNYADEFDVCAYKVFSEKQWNNFQKYVKLGEGEICISLGSNEFLEYISGEDFLNCCSIHRQNYTLDEIEVLDGFGLDLDSFGIFSQVVEDMHNDTFTDEDYEILETLS